MAERVPLGPRLCAALRAAWMVTLLLLVASRPDELWSVSFAAAPPLGALAWTTLYVALALAFRASRGGSLRNGLLAATLLGYHLSFEVEPLGDYADWTILCTTQVVYASEPFANVLYHLVQRALGPTALPFVSPLAGAVTTWTFLAVTDRLFARRAGSPATAARAAALAWLAWGGQLSFFTNYVENTQLCLPFVLAWVLALVRLVEGRAEYARGMRSRQAALVRCAAAFGAAALVHAQVAFLAPAMVLAILFSEGGESRPGRRLREALAALSLSAAVFAAGILSLGALGFDVRAGNAFGGGDQRFFVPLFQGTGGPFERFTLFSPAHGRELANVLLFAGAVVPLWLASAARTARARGATLRAPSRERRVLGILALAEASFLFLYQFDLGFPADLDLMTSLTLVLVLWSLERARAAGLSALAVLSTCACGLVLSSGLLWSSLHSRDGGDPRVALSVDGVHARSPSEPLTVELAARSESVSFEIAGPPGALCALVTGPVVEGGYKPAFAAAPFHVAPEQGELRRLFTGRLDAAGRARGTLFMGELVAPEGSAVLQALVAREPPLPHPFFASGAVRLTLGRRRDG